MYYDFHFWPTLLTVAVIIGVLQGTVAYLILLERKVAAYVQDRVGPNRVGPFGLLQPLADGAKFVLKEQLIPAHVDRVFYLVAPAVALLTATVAFAVVPFGRTMPPPPVPWPQTVQEQERLDPAIRQQVEAYNQSYQFVVAPHVDIGIVFVFAIGSLAVYGVILGGWSSNNKYSLLGSLRSSAQIISYEIPMGMSVLGLVLFTHSLNLERILDHQLRHGWFILYQPLAFLLFLTSVFAECNRLPFDLPEAEQELVGGYHTEYSGWKFGLFFLGEYTHMITTSFLAVVLFFGGWHLPGLTSAADGVVLKVLVLAAKMFAFILFFMLVRWTIPRFRFDQLMGLAWRTLIPLALLNLVAAMVVREMGWSPWVLLPVSLALIVAAAWLTLHRPADRRGKIVVIRGHQRVEIAAP